MTTQTSTKNGEFVRRFLAALELLDIDAISELVTDDIIWKVPGDLSISGTYDGKPAFVNEFLGGAAALFAAGSLNFDIQHLFSTGDVVVAEYIGTGESATTGKPYRNEYCVIFGFRDGKIDRVREYLDTAQVAEVLLTSAA